MDTRPRALAASQRLRHHFSRMQTAPQLTAVIDCLFEIVPSRTAPTFVELAVVDGTLVFARARGETTFRHYVGPRDELAVNLLGFVAHLGLGPTERAYVLDRIAQIPRRADAA
ncbi:MAG: hypothetical protein NVS2B3_10170 [Vulcanimicrobiaceae bacterium]